MQNFNNNTSILKLSNGISLIRCNFENQNLKTHFVTFKLADSTGFVAYFAITRFYEKLIVRVHADFSLKMQKFAERFVKSFCDF